MRERLGGAARDRLGVAHLPADRREGRAGVGVRAERVLPRGGVLARDPVGHIGEAGGGDPREGFAQRRGVRELDRDVADAVVAQGLEGDREHLEVGVGRGPAHALHPRLRELPLLRGAAPGAAEH